MVECAVDELDVDGTAINWAVVCPLFEESDVVFCKTLNGLFSLILGSSSILCVTNGRMKDNDS